jgi:hypothetical protein
VKPLAILWTNEEKFAEKPSPDPLAQDSDDSCR